MDGSSDNAALSTLQQRHDNLLKTYMNIYPIQKVNVLDICKPSGERPQ